MHQTRHNPLKTRKLAAAAFILQRRPTDIRHSLSAGSDTSPNREIQARASIAACSPRTDLRSV
jgi:hypothetical protein